MYNLEAFTNDPIRAAEITADWQTELTSPIVTSAKIKLTEGCNLRCVMCKYWHSHPENELTATEVTSIIDQLQPMGLQKVHLSGGEIFLRDDLLEIIAQISARKIRVNITTNGTLIDKAKAEALLRARVRSISVSIDGPNEKVHDRLRGQVGAFAATTQALRYLAAARAKLGRNVKLRINTVISKKNYRLMPDMIRLAASLEAHELHPMPIDENIEKRKKLSLSKAQIEEYNRTIAPEVAALRADYGFSTDEDFVYPFGRTEREIQLSADTFYARDFYREHVCFVPWLHAFIDWKGDVSLCCMTRGRMESLGNIRQQTFREIFNGEKYRAVRSQFLRARLSVCHHCDDFRKENRLLNQFVPLRAGHAVEK